MDAPSPRVSFALISMEGPDQYSQAGGLGVRVSQLSRALAKAGHPTRLYFVGDPDLPAAELSEGVELRRIGQEIARQFPGGVYQGERLKVSYLAARFPEQLLQEWALPQLKAGRIPVMLFEEWQTASWALRSSELLRELSLGGGCLLLWNANNQFGFERIDWVGLERAAGITTISRHMRLLVGGFGVDPIVIPNGIPEEYLLPVNPNSVRELRQAAGDRQVLLKVGRFHRDKRWVQAVRALGELRAARVPVRMLARGGNEQYREEVMGAAQKSGLRVAQWDKEVTQVADLARALRSTPDVDLLELTRFLPEELLPVLYASSLAVLANSGFEPFGLVGLETMAAGGVAVVGATGEDYARHLHNSLVIESDSPVELAQVISRVVAQPLVGEEIRQSARAMAGTYSWPLVVEGDLLPRLPLLAQRQGMSWPGSGIPV
ncbi:MAG TPA: glycosyltransferase family 4 protein [Candidatus Dormibacteraeota bacterium]|nr:glycosyltransferase family 4 protein [Candidatus Dormibacteraeota bacterium]